MRHLGMFASFTVGFAVTRCASFFLNGLTALPLSAAPDEQTCQCLCSGLSVLKWSSHFPSTFVGGSLVTGPVRVLACHLPRITGIWTGSIHKIYLSVCLSIYLSIYSSIVYLSIHLYIHACVHACIRTCARACACVRSCVRTYIHAYMHTCMHTYIHTYIPT